MSISRVHVVHFQRKPASGHFSVEAHFEDVRRLIDSRVDVDLKIMPELSRGILPRLRNMNFARKHQADVSHILGDIHYVATLLNPHKTILTVLDCEMLHRTIGLRRALLKLFWFTIPSRRVAAMTVISEATRHELLRHISFPAKDVHVIPVFINAEYRHCPRPFNADCPAILQVGTRHNKNLERLIRALEDTTCRLLIVGPLSEEQRRLLMQTNIPFENHVNLHSDEIANLYNRCDMLCFVSTHEGFGMPILEAQTVGRPVVTSNCSSMPEVAGKGAILADPLHIDDIRSAVRRVISNAQLRDELIESGLENAKKYARDRVAEQYCDLYESLARS